MLMNDYSLLEKLNGIELFIKNKTILCSLTYGNSLKKLSDIGILKEN